MSAPIKLPEDRFMRIALLPIVHDALKSARSVGGPFPDAEPFVSAIIRTLRTFETSPLNRERSAPVSPAPEAVTPAPWSYQEDSDAYTHIVRGPSGEFICSAPQSTLPHAEANMRLVAQLRNATNEATPVAVPPSEERERLAEMRKDAGPLGSAVCVLETLAGRQISDGAPVALFPAEARALLAALRSSTPVAPVVEGETALALNERIWDLARTTIANRIRQVRFEERNRPRLARAAQVLANSAESDLLDLLTTPVVFARTSTDTPTTAQREAE